MLLANTFASEEQRKAVMAKLHPSSGGGHRSAHAPAANPYGAATRNATDRSQGKSTRQSKSKSLKNPTAADKERAAIRHSIEMRDQGFTQRADGNWEKRRPSKTDPASLSDRFWNGVRDHINDLLGSAGNLLSEDSLDGITMSAMEAGPVGMPVAAGAKTISWAKIGLKAATAFVAAELSSTITESRKNPDLPYAADSWYALGTGLLKGIAARCLC